MRGFSHRRRPASPARTRPRARRGGCGRPPVHNPGLPACRTSPGHRRRRSTRPP
ncbi:hypothetical protein ISF6_0920 [Piscinibacter sakaiensis]|uniref:Uncharacterized protein n=1 Tax=Piscinibacter sakaiensis TaxID=1547922 RepID=A0A0K8NYF9_PISS1|nr:hypothetical protein ISF6_0920 [Piscinibacter sakaiensis]